jgi:uncharacterized protein YndB with AHSA1/START domain
MGAPPDIVREVRIDASPHEVFAYFTDPDKMIVWKALEATLDPRPGGVFWIDVTGRDVARGEYVEIDPPRRVVFTFGWESEGSPLPPGASTVEITLVPDGDGTLLRLVHTGVPETIRAGSTAGWDHYLPRLVVAAEGGDPGADPWIRASDTRTRGASDGSAAEQSQSAAPVRRGDERPSG